MAKAVSKKVNSTKKVNTVEEDKVLAPKEGVDESTQVQEEVIVQEPIQEVVTTPVKEDKKVKIKMGSNHRCCIGGDWYVFIKDKEYNVPPNVKEILNRGGLIKPL